LENNEIEMTMEKGKNEYKPIEQGATPFVQTYLHGTKADTQCGGSVAENS